MKLAFTIEAFFEIFEHYNLAVFPMQLIFIIFGLLALLSFYNKHPYKDIAIGFFLVGLWLWTGIVYHIYFFSSINPAAYGFGVLFILQALLFLRGIIKSSFVFEFSSRAQYYWGYFFVLFALVIYPAISYYLEQSLFTTISIGLPCPTLILTFGFLLLMSNPIPKHLLIIPLIWTCIGTSAAVLFGVYQDYAMAFAAIVVLIYYYQSKKQLATELRPT